MIAIVFLVDRQQNVDSVLIRKGYAYLVDMWRVSICDAHSLFLSSTDTDHGFRSDSPLLVWGYSFWTLAVRLSLFASDYCSYASHRFVPLVKIPSSSLSSWINYLLRTKTRGFWIGAWEWSVWISILEEQLRINSSLSLKFLWGLFCKKWLNGELWHGPELRPPDCTIIYTKLNRQICEIQVRYVYSDLLSSIGGTQKAS